MSADLHHLSAAYALDALDDVERQQFENHYPTCEICSADVKDFESVAAELAASIATPAPASMKASVMTQIGQTRQVSPLASQRAATVRANPFSGRVILSLAAAMLLLAGVLVVTLPSKDGPSFDEVAAASDSIVTSLDALDEDQAGNLQVVWSDELDGVAVIGSNLEDPGAGLAYALWFLLDDGVVPAGLFNPTDGSIKEVLDVADINTTGWGITIEPEGGSEQPTTPILFSGTI